MRRDWEAVFFEAFEVECNGFPDVSFDFALCRSGRDTARKVRAKGGEVFLSLFDDDEIFAHFSQVATRNHPSSTMSRIASRTFMISVPWGSQSVNAKIGGIIHGAKGA